MSYAIQSPSQRSFAAAVSRVLRESRHRQNLTQAELARRTGGLVSKAALANYETGHRSIRVDVLWIIAGALGENVGDLMIAAHRDVMLAPTASTESITVDTTDLFTRNDPMLAPVRRWSELRPSGQMTLDQQAITALASLMNVSEPECRRILWASSVPESSSAIRTSLFQDPDATHRSHHHKRRRPATAIQSSVESGVPVYDAHTTPLAD